VKIGVQTSTSTTVCVALVLGFGFGCGGGGAPHPASADSPRAGSASQEKPAAEFDLEATLALESKGLTDRPVSGPEKAWSVKVPSAGDPKVSVVEDIHLVEIPIGSDAVVRCQVHAEGVDPAGSLYGVIKASSAQVEYREVTPAGVKLLAGFPAAFLNALYVTDVPGGKAAGGLKLAIHARSDRTLLCVHDELGYRETFQRVSSAFFETFKEAKPPKDNATYTDISIVKLDDLPVGFGVTQLVPGPKPGERERHDSSSSFLPTSPKDVIFEDTFNITRYDKKGQIISDTFVEATQGEVNMQLTLTRSEDGKYTYDGKISGKAVQGALATPKGLTTSFQTAATLRKKLKAGSAFQDTIDEYHPSVDPTAVVAVTYAHAKGAPARQVTMKMGERVVTSEMDDDGMARIGTFDLGKRKLTIERLRVDGHP
jgi:hypothetical protein